MTMYQKEGDLQGRLPQIENIQTEKAYVSSEDL